MIHRKLVVLASLLVGFVNIALAGVGDLDTLNVRSQAPVKERMPVIAYKFNPKSLILPASLITVGAATLWEKRSITGWTNFAWLL